MSGGVADIGQVTQCVLRARDSAVSTDQRRICEEIAQALMRRFDIRVKPREAADEIERLRPKLKQAVWSDSEECKMLTAENERLRSDNDWLRKAPEVVHAAAADATALLRAEIERLQAELNSRGK